MGTVFTDVTSAIEEAQWMAEATGIPHLLIINTDGQMQVIQWDEPFKGRVLEKFN